LSAHDYKEYEVTLGLLVVVNTLSTMYTLNRTMRFHTEQLSNDKVKMHNDLLQGVFTQSIDQFESHPEMHYFFNELFNDIYSEVTIRQVEQEQMICFKILKHITDYIEFFYLHIDLQEYKDSVEKQNYKILKLVTKFLKSPTFKSNTYMYLQNFAGINTKHYFQTFLGIHP
jgi:hypothetical protein